MKEHLLAFGFVFFLATQCPASVVPRRGVDLTLDSENNSVDDIFYDAPLQLENEQQENFWDAIEEEAMEFHDATSDDDLAEFPWSQTSDDDDDDDDESDDLDDLFLEELSAEDRIDLGAIGGWIKTKAKQIGATAKAIFVRAGGKKLLEQGLNLIKALKVRVDPISCANASCGTCIYIDVPPMNGHKACLRFGMLDKYKIGALLHLGERILFEQSIGLSGKALCTPLPFPIGPICLQSIQVRKNGTDMGSCMIFVVKQFKVGAQMCAKYEDGHLKPTFKAMRIPAEEKFDTVFILNGKNRVEEVTPEVEVEKNTSETQTDDSSE